MATESTTPNFFLLLELNPDDRWDEKAFEQALKQKQREWGLQSQSIGKKALDAKRNIQLIPQIRQTMSDPAEREKQATAARTERAAGRQRRIEEFETQLKFAQGKGYLEEADLKGFIADFKDVLTEKEIRSSIKVSIQTPVSEQSKPAQQLDASVAKEIAEKLAQLSLSSLYELLGRASTHSRADLVKLAEQLYLDMVRRQPKTLEVTLKQELAGHAKNIFASEDMRQRYDESLRHAPLNALLKVLDDTLNRATHKEVYAQQVLDFLEAAQKVGWSREQALAKLEEHVRLRKWFMRVPALDMTPQQRCGYCGQMNDRGRNFCQKCNRELNVTCPNCGQPVPADAVGCGGCGFRVGDRYWVDDSLEKCRLLLASGDLKEVQELLRELEVSWKPAKPDKRVEKIREDSIQAQRLQQAQQELIAQLNSFISQRQFYAARQFLATHTENLPDRAVHQRTVEAEISRAQELVRRVQSSTLSREESADLCRQALQVCADYQEARALLSTMPPSPPANLQANVGGSIVSLTWELSPTRGVSYKVVCKSRSKPVSVADGTLLETVTGRLYDDTKPEIGLPLYYAVFAESEGIISTQGAVLAQPVLLTQDVSTAMVQVNDSRVDLSWQVPPYTAAVVVVRKEGETPRSMNDGKACSLLDLTHLSDREVHNDHLYFYGLYCQFKDLQGRLVSSSGIVVQARLETPPAPITELEISSTKVTQGYDIRLQWQPPSKGRTVILKSGQRLPFKVGQVLPRGQLGQYGQIVQEDSPGMLALRGVQPGIGFYAPVVLLGETAYIGVCQRHICIEDISELKYQNLGTSLRLQWKWPPNCQEALVSYSYHGWPKLEEQTENTHKVSRTEYEFHGHYDIKGTTMGQNYHIVVAAIVGQGRDQVISSGARIEVLLAERVILTYEIKTPTMFRKKRTLHLFPRNSGKLPVFLLVSRRDRLPMSKAEGEQLLRMGPLLVERDKEVVVELPDRSFPPRTFGKLYLEDDNAYSVVRIDHPGQEKLRLS